MLRLSLILILLLEGCWELRAQVGVKISGKIRILEPTTIKVETVTGELLLSTDVGFDGEFSQDKTIDPAVKGKLEGNMYSASLDSKEGNWRKMLEEEKLLCCGMRRNL